MLRGSSFARLLASIGNVLDGEAAGADAGPTAPPSARGDTVPQVFFNAGVPVEAAATIISAAVKELCNNLDSCLLPQLPAPAPLSPAPDTWTGGGGTKAPSVTETGGGGSKTPTTESASPPSGYCDATTPSTKAPSVSGDGNDSKSPSVKRRHIFSPPPEVAAPVTPARRVDAPIGGWWWPVGR